jgi:hypothetical protein
MAVNHVRLLARHAERAVQRLVAQMAEHREDERESVRNSCEVPNPPLESISATR